MPNKNAKLWRVIPHDETILFYRNHNNQPFEKSSQKTIDLKMKNYVPLAGNTGEMFNDYLLS